MTRRLRPARRVAPALVALAAALVPAAPASAAVRIAGLRPHLQAGDRPDRSAADRATFSPNGDGINDAVLVRAFGPPGRRARLVGSLYLGGDTVVFRSAPFRFGRSGLGRAAWRGEGVTRDGSYRLKVCLLRGRCSRPAIVARRTLSAAIAATGSFAPGSTVPLLLGTDRPSLTAQVLPDDEAGPPLLEVALPGGSSGSLPLPPTIAPGLYRLVVTDGAGSRRALPLVVRSSAPIESPPAGAALVVMPYLTWRAYSFTDDDRDGIIDSWYIRYRHDEVSLVGPYEDPTRRPVLDGREADADHTRPFMRWFGSRPRRAQFVTDVELGTIPPEVLARYRAVVFPGHEEYYLPETYDLLRGFLAGGGRVAFLSANSYFSPVRVLPARNRMQLLQRGLRTPERSDRALVGVGFSGCCLDEPSYQPYVVEPTAAADAPWLLQGTGLAAGDRFGLIGGEFDATGPFTPPETRVLARASMSQRGVGVRAELALTPTAGGGEVFATGNMGFLLNVEADPRVARLLDNVWTHLVR